MKIRFFGHSFFSICFGKTNILIDPFVSSFSKEDAFKRIEKCPVDLKDLKKADAVFISNENFDHFDKEIVESLVLRDNCVVVSHESILGELDAPNHLKKAVKMNDCFSFRGINFEVLSAHCPSCFYPLGLVLEKNQERVFFAGDNSLTDSFLAVKSNVALLPIGGAITMDIIDAVKATKLMKPDFVIPMHYNTFNLIKQDPFDFKSRIEKSVLKTKPVVLKPGQAFSF